MAATKTDVASVAIDQGDESLKWWVPDEEPDVAYGFCSQCGGSLFWRSADRPDTRAIAAGTLDVPTGLKTRHAIYVSDASDYHRLDLDLSDPYADGAIGN